MTPLMMLALTLPPSAAYVAGKVLAWHEQRLRKLSDEQAKRIDSLEIRAGIHDQDLDGARDGLDKHAAELKRLNEQLTTLSERFYQR